MQLTFSGGFDVTRGVIADQQRCVNLYPEMNPSGASAPWTMYLTPGTIVVTIPGTQFGPQAGVSRGGYYATNGKFYSVVGQNVYFVDAQFRYFLLGTLAASANPLTTPVIMVDNGNVLVIVDGTDTGYAVDLSTDQFGQIIDPGYLGASFVDYLDTFLVFNEVGTKFFFCSLSDVTFDQLCVSPGQPLTGTITNAPGGNPNGVFNNVALTGGEGTGATATITVTGGVVTAVVLDPTGSGYEVNDVLGAAAVGGAAFKYTINTISPYAFDPTFVAAKTGFPDTINALIVMHREIWLGGSMKTTEIWYDAGGTNFPFQIIPGIFLEHGVYAPYSLKKYDLITFFLGIDAAGVATVYKGEGYKITPISTWGIAQELQSYIEAGLDITDAIGMVYKQDDHAFYVLTFPTANVTWVYDITQSQQAGIPIWHQRTWTGADGSENRIRLNWISQAYGKIVGGDWETGELYQLDLNTYQDAGEPIVRRRGFPHLMNDGKRVTYDSFIGDFECGDATLAVAVNDLNAYLRWSDDRGKTWGTPIEMTLGAQGQFLTQPIWRQLGMARDRVFELFWSCPMNTSLDGAFIQTSPAQT